MARQRPVPGSAPALGCRRVRPAPDLENFERPLAGFFPSPREGAWRCARGGRAPRDRAHSCRLPKVRTHPAKASPCLDWRWWPLADSASKPLRIYRRTPAPRTPATSPIPRTPPRDLRARCSPLPRRIPTLTPKERLRSPSAAPTCRADLLLGPNCNKPESGFLKKIV